MGDIIAIVGIKEKVGKTTVAMNLSHALACRPRKRTLVIDMDPKGAATKLLIPKRYQKKYGLHNIFSNNISVEQCVFPTRYERLYCLPNYPATNLLEPSISAHLPESLYDFRDKIRPHLIDNYDFTLIDCPTNMGSFVLAALFVANCVVVPDCGDNEFSVHTFEKIKDIINDVFASNNLGLKTLKLLVNKVDKRTAKSKIIMEEIHNCLSVEEVFQTTIPANTLFRRAEDEFKTINRYAPSSPGAKAFRSLALELVENTKH